MSFCFFFFSSRRRHTRFDCDWSSDVCSSDLGQRLPLVHRGLVDDDLELAVLGGHAGGGGAADQLLLVDAVLDQGLDRDHLEPVLATERHQLGQARHAAFLVEHLADHPGRPAAGQAGQVDRGLGVAGAAEYAARHGPQREDVPGTREVLRPRRRIHQRADGDRAIVGGGSGGHAPAGVHADREGGAERRGVVGDHHRDLQLVEALAEHGHADEPAPVLGHEVDRLRGRLLGGHEQVPLVLAVLVVDHDEHATGADLLDAFLDRNELRLAHRIPSLASGPFPGAGGSRNCKTRCTYLPIISISRFTRLPRASPPRVVATSVCGMTMISKSRSLSRATVRLTPSTATEPCGISSGAIASPGHSIVSRAVSACRVSAATVPTPSTCPWTRCPPTMPPSRIGRSRLTGSPTARSPSAVRASVSGPTSKRSLPAPTSTTVRQAPFTATLAPTPLSSRTRSAPSTRRDPARSSTRPTSSTRPVNMSALHAAFQEPVAAQRPRGEVAQAQGITQREAGAARWGRRVGSAQD